MIAEEASAPGGEEVVAVDVGHCVAGLTLGQKCVFNETRPAGKPSPSQSQTAPKAQPRSAKVASVVQGVLRERCQTRQVPKTQKAPAAE